MNRRVFYFDAVKAVLILLVVCCHAIEIGAYGDGWGQTVHLFGNLFMMPVFLFVQGYWSKRTAVSDQKILGRLLFFFALFCIGKLLYYGGYRLIDGALPPWTGESFWDEGSVPWYMISSVFFTGSLWLARCLRGKPVLLFCTVVGMAAGCFPQIGVRFSMSRTLVFMPFYLAGYYFPKRWMEKLMAWKIRAGWKLIGGAAVGLASALWAVRFLLIRVSQAYWTGRSLAWGNAGYAAMGLSIPQGCLWRGVCWLVSLLLGSAFLLAVPSKCGIAGINRIAGWVGANTLPVYLLHYPVLLLLCRKVFPPDMLILPLVAACMVLTLILSAPVLSKPIVWLREKTLELATPNQETV